MADNKMTRKTKLPKIAFFQPSRIIKDDEEYTDKDYWIPLPECVSDPLLSVLHYAGSVPLRATPIDSKYDRVDGKKWFVEINTPATFQKEYMDTDNDVKYVIEYKSNLSMAILPYTAYGMNMKTLCQFPLCIGFVAMPPNGSLTNNALFDRNGVILQLFQTIFLIQSSKNDKWEHINQIEMKSLINLGYIKQQLEGDEVLATPIGNGFRSLGIPQVTFSQGGWDTVKVGLGNYDTAIYVKNMRKLEQDIYRAAIPCFSFASPNNMCHKYAAALIHWQIGEKLSEPKHAGHNGFIVPFVEGPPKIVVNPQIPTPVPVIREVQNVPRGSFVFEGNRYSVYIQGDNKNEWFVGNNDQTARIFHAVTLKKEILDENDVFVSEYMGDHGDCEVIDLGPQNDGFDPHYFHVIKCPRFNRCYFTVMIRSLKTKYYRAAWVVLDDGKEHPQPPHTGALKLTTLLEARKSFGYIR